MALARLFFSFFATIVLLAVLAIGAAIATFIENDYGFETAKALVYNARWYEIILLLTTINLIGIIYNYKMWKHLGRFLLHISFVVILIGAFLTRYFGYEGIMHIREGQTTNRMISYEPYLQIEVEKDSETYYSDFQLLLPATKGVNFKKTLTLDDEKITIELVDYRLIRDENIETAVATFNVSAKGETKEYSLLGSMGMEGVAQTHQFGDMKIKMTRGSKPLELPFRINLREFILERYPGSMSPSSYASEVTVIDGDEIYDYRIFMNHTLYHRGYKFFQSSYDIDEKGTVLSVNKDPGKIPTYIGYFLLTLGFILNLFDSKSRFAKLARYLKSNTAVAILALLFILTQPLYAKEQPEIFNTYIQEFNKNSKEIAEKFGKLVTQNYMGRMMPINTLSMELLSKISRKNKLFGLSSDQAILGMMTAPEVWQGLKFIRVKHPELEKKLGAHNGYISFNDAFSDDGRYILKDEVERAMRKDPAKMGTYEKEIIRVDERLNITFMIFNGSILKLFPKPNDPNNTWYPPLLALEEFETPYNKEVADILQGFFGSVMNADWERANRYIINIQDYQEKYGSTVMPSETQLALEVFSNKAQIFQNLTLTYIFIGPILFLIAFIQIFKPQWKMERIKLAFLIFLSLLFAIHTIAMGIRWYISGHAPWSDSYESLLYIAWSTMLAGILFFRKSFLALAGTVIMAAAFMFSAHLSWIDPQITSLVPVLKSYWLTIHVSVITASYGFFALGAILGFFALILFIIRNPSKPYIDIEIKKITAINEIALIIGISLFTIGNFLGGVWANESWGRYWGWDPKETWSYILIIAYTIVLHLRFIKPLDNPFVFSVMSLLAFSTVLMTYFGVNFYLTGMHSYASGDPVPIPTWVYILIATTFITIVAASFKRDLSKII